MNALQELLKTKTRELNFIKKVLEMPANEMDVAESYAQR